ncbi:MAG: hypothetical protein WCP55_19015, partial [Lentisphaerota bacterium]
VPLQKLRDLTYLHFVIGSMPENNLASIHERHDLELFLLPKSKVSERRSIVILSRRQNENDIDSMLDKLDFKSASLPVTAAGTAENWDLDRNIGHSCHYRRKPGGTCPGGGSRFGAGLAARIL